MRRTTLFPFVVLAVLVFGSCAVNPATGERQLILISESTEIEMGREADVSITASMGLYDDPEMAAWIEQMGFRLQAVAERPDLPWTFRLIDDPIVNAFALPGGFVYITRGILAHLGSEAQLAAVLGHEIGHVTGRHGAEQMSRAQITQLGLGIGSLISPAAATISQVAGAGLGLLFLRYGRDDERQADALGLRYMTDASYDPREMPAVFTMLGRVSGGGEGGGVPSWLSTHPEPADRYERISQAITETAAQLEGAEVGAASYLDHIDGMVYGEDPRDGFFDGPLFMHPNLEFQLRFPAEWQTANQPQAVIAVSPEENAIMQLTIVPGDSPRQVVREFLTNNGLSGSVATTKVGGLDGARADFSATTQDGGTVSGRILVVGYRGDLYQIVGYGTAEGWGQHRRRVQRSQSSFARLTDPEALAIQPLRLEIATTRRTQSLAEYHADNPMEISAEQLALLNQMEVGTVIRSGTRIKTVVRR